MLKSTPLKTKFRACVIRSKESKIARIKAWLNGSNNTPSPAQRPSLPLRTTTCTCRQKPRRHTASKPKLREMMLKNLRLSWLNTLLELKISTLVFKSSKDKFHLNRLSWTSPITSQSTGTLREATTKPSRQLLTLRRAPWPMNSKQLKPLLPTLLSKTIVLPNSKWSTLKVL